MFVDMTSNVSIKIGVGVIVTVLACLSGYVFCKSTTTQMFGQIIPRVETTQKVVALTFDDAPSSQTDKVLKILKQKNVRATFYMIGKAIEENPKEAKAVVQAGMEIGNHTYSHPRLLFKSLAIIDFEIQQTNKLIRDAGYLGEITFRPPYGKKLVLLPWYLRQHGIKTIMWDVDLEGYYSGHTRPGSIIILHPFCGKECELDRKAIPVIIDELRTRGYRFVTIAELLSERNNP
jgi:peptidoglycan-N-acetylglucosamine deacetylase